MNEIVEILMRRDGISQLEAENIVDEVSNILLAAVVRGDLNECEDIIKDELGLEPDYLMYFLR